jgi:ABC-type branched-subunit amino acid transport system substrate-binding protein
MPVKFPQKTLNILMLLVAGLLLIILAILVKHRYFKSNNMNAAYRVGVIINPSELPSGQMAILKDIVEHKLQVINEQGGIEGRKLEVFYVDDQNNDKKLYALVQQTSQDTNVIAYIGCRGISRSKIIAPLLTQRKIPFIGLYVFTQLFKDYPTMYTASIGVQEAQKVFEEMLKAKGKRIGIIGDKDAILTKLMLEAVEQIVSNNPGMHITLRRFYPPGHLYDPEKAGS